MMKAVSHIEIEKYSENQKQSVKDLVAVEEPLEIRLKYHDGIEYKEKRLAVTMRTPGHDFELALGFLKTEGIIQSKEEVSKIFYCEEIKDEREKGNVVVVHIANERSIPESIFNRNFYVNSSCGVCGKSSIESIESLCELTVLPSDLRLDQELISKLPEFAREDQPVFKHTGGLHASAAFDQKGTLKLIREDIGRHNALDKLIGAGMASNLDFSKSILFVSGRAGFELVQKAIVSQFPIMIAVGAPSSLAIDLARKFNLTLIGFARDDSFNVYSGVERIES